MTNETALTVFSLDEMMSLGEVLYKSGYFDDTKSQAQAVVKILAGRELGIGPIASMMGINIIQGKPALGSNLIAATVKSHPRYDYKVKQADNNACIIEWFESGKKVGESSFTMEEAQRTKYYEKGEWKILAQKWNWQNYPSDMLFARAMTRGQKRYAPDLGGGAPIYTAEELNGENEVVDVIPTPVPEDVVEPGPEPGNDYMPINSPRALYDAVHGLEYYNSIPHMLNTIRKVSGDAKANWPTDDAAWYNEALAQLTEYAQANRAQEVIQATAQKLDL